MVIVHAHACAAMGSRESRKVLRMLEDSDIIKITVNQEYLGEDALNVFWYIYGLVAAGVTLVDVALDFIDHVWEFVQESQHPVTETVTLKMENMTNAIDVDVVSLGTFGLDDTGGLAQPSYVASGFSMDVSDKTTRPGSKRFVGIGETRTTANTYDAGGTVADDIETALSNFVDVIGGAAGEGTIIPVIVGRDEFGQPDLTRVSPVTSSTVSSTIRSQVSRRV